MDISGNRTPERPSADWDERWRATTRLAALAALTLAGLALCAYVAYPFLPALTWALALAVIAFPLHAWLTGRVSNRNWAAGLSTAAVVLIILVPVVLVAGQLAREAAATGQQLEAMAREGRVETAAGRVPYGPQVVDWVRHNVDLEAEGRRLAARFAGDAGALLEGSGWVLVQLLVCVFVLFFAFRDWSHLLDAMGGLSPLRPDEADYLFRRVSDSIHATVYATVVISVIQGVTGGLLFWAFGLPAPLLWGVIMTVLGIIPLVGAFLVWVPAAVILAMDDRWAPAVVLVTWGLLMAGPFGNWMYAHLAGDRLRLHPVPVLIAFVGGLVVFGISGMVLGPAILAVTLGLLDVWRRRLGSAAMVALPAPDGPPDRDRVLVTGS
jgi:predicted PurR-regulated permease PerM